MSRKMKVMIACSLLINSLIMLSIVAVFYKVGAVNAVAKVQSVLSGDETKDTYISAKRSIFESLETKKGGIVFLGDSLTEMGEWQELFDDSNIVNRGVSGDTSKGILDRLDSIVKSRPSKVFIMVGTNDLNKGVSVQVISDYCERILTLLSGSELYVQSVLPVNDILHSKRTNKDIQELNESLKQVSERHKAVYVNLYSAFSDETGQLKTELTEDGLHLNGKGYNLWKQQIEQYVTN